MKNYSLKFKIFNFALSFYFLIFSILIPSAAAQDFNPNQLISDERFVDTGTLGGVEGIQKFLESRGSILANPAPEFLSKLREPGDVNLKSRLPDPRPNLGRPRTAAELIFDAAISAGLNPQVVLVTLQKEQSLITGSFTGSALTRALDRALGFGCPDEGGCGELFLGFYHQLFGNFDAEGNRYIGMPASLVRSFYFEVGGTRVGRGPMVDAQNNAFGNGNRVRTSRKGDEITLENTTGGPQNPPATQTVTLSNFATTALYRYTPHVYNGNYNFSKFFTAWFRYPNGTLLGTGDGKIFIIDNGLRRPISAFVLKQRKLNPAAVITVSASELNEFELGQMTPPANGTLLVNPQGTVYLIEDGLRKELSPFVAAARKLNTAGAALLPDEDVQSYPAGPRALPTDGTLVKAGNDPTVFMIYSGEKRPLSGFVFKSRKLSFASVLTAESAELDSYPTGKLMPPADGTLVKARESPAVYHVGNGKLEPLTYIVFKLQNFSFSAVQSTAAAELDLWEKGGPMPPPTGILIKANNNPAVYYIEAGLRRPISYGVFLASKFSFANVKVATPDELSNIELGEPLKLPERALVKTADNAAVYYVVEGLLRPLTLAAFQNRLLRFSDVVTISAEEFAQYPVGAVVEN